jgi:hypothetical protein
MIKNIIGSLFQTEFDRLPPSGQLREQHTSAANLRWLAGLAVLLAIILVLLLPLSPALTPMPGRDSGVFLYTGQQILQGQIPYRDVWDHKGPILFFINAIGLRLFNGSAWGVWLMVAIALWLSVVMCFLLLRRLFTTWAAVFATIALVCSIDLLAFGYNKTELYALPLQFIAFYLFYEIEQHGQVRWWGFGLGLTFALTFFLQQNLAVLWGVIVLYWIARAVYLRTWKLLFRQLSTFLLGFLAVALPLFVYLASYNALEAYFNAAFGYNFVYSSDTNMLKKLVSPIYGLYELARSGITLLAVGGWLVAVRDIWRSRRESMTAKSALILVALIGLPVNALSTSLSGTSYAWYFIEWLPVFCIFVAYLADSFLFHREAGDITLKTTSSKMWIIAFMAAMIFQTVGFWMIEDFAIPLLSPDTKTTDPVLDYIQRHTDNNDYLLMWGVQAEYNFLSGRSAPTRFVYQLPLYRRAYQRPALINEFYGDLQANPPALIVDTSSINPNIPPIDALRRQSWPIDGDTVNATLPEMDAVFQFIDDHYQRIGEIGDEGWVAYEYINP